MHIARGSTSQPICVRRPRPSIISDDSAITSLEFALVGPLMFLLTLMVIAFGGFVFGRAVLDNATIDAVRTIQTGQAFKTPAAFASTLCQNAVFFQSNCAGLQYNIQAGTAFGLLNTSIHTDSVGDLATSTGTAAQRYPALPITVGTSAGAAVPKPYVIVQVAYKWTFGSAMVARAFGFKNGILLVSTAAFENEPY